MLKQEAIDILARHRGETLSVVTMQAAAPWHLAGQGRTFNVDASGCMGSAASLGLGLALGSPQRKVIAIDGDGSLLMQLGSLVTVAGAAPDNFYHFVFVNRLYESSGNQPLPGIDKLDFSALALASGYASAVRFVTATEFDAGLPQVLTRRGPVFIELEIARDDAPTRWPGVPMALMVNEMRQQLGVQ